MNGYLIPANSKKSLLFMGMFNSTDLWILGTGILISLVFMFAISADTLLALVIKLSESKLEATINPSVPVPVAKLLEN